MKVQTILKKPATRDLSRYFDDHRWDDLDDFFDEVDDLLDDAIEKLEDVSEEKQLEALLGIKELEKAFEKNRGKMLRFLGKLKHKNKVAQTKIDTAQVKMHLAKLDGQDALELVRRRVAKLHHKLKALKNTANKEAKEIFYRLSLELSVFGDKIG